jgi:hypothetical protein
LVETNHTSIGLWGLYLIKSETQPEMLKKSFTRRDNKFTGSLIIYVMNRRKIRKQLQLTST